MEQFTIVNIVLALVAIIACILAFYFSTKNDALKAEIVELEKEHQSNLRTVDKVATELERAMNGYKVVKAELDKCQGQAIPTKPVRKPKPKSNM